MAAEVTIRNPSYWSGRAPQLAQILRTAGEGPGPGTIGDPTGLPPDAANLFAVVDPQYWSGQPRELQEALADAAGAAPDTGATPIGGAAGATSVSQERLTLSVDEAAVALGISRAFAYDAIKRNEIPHIKIGKRILIPRVALDRMLDSSGADPS
jgi:excisionase family DNA binding protein